MPLFSKSTFRSGKKPLKRKSVSLSNISSLDESTYSIHDLRLEAGPLTLKLGESELVFKKDGRWVQAPNDKNRPSAAVTEENHKKVLDENNLLKYKIELLLDMLAASNADNYVLQRELEEMKRKKQTKLKHR